MEGVITNNEPTIADFITQTAAGVNIRRVNPATPPVAVPGTSRMSPTPSDVVVPGASRESSTTGNDSQASAGSRTIRCESCSCEVSRNAHAAHLKSIKHKAHLWRPLQNNVSVCRSAFRGSKIEQKSKDFAEKDSGWVLENILYLEININKYNPLRAAAYLPLPKEITNKKAVLNIRNTEYCFAWSIVAGMIKPKGRASLTTSYPHFSNIPGLNFAGMDFPVALKSISKFERLNNMSINVYGIEKEFIDGKSKYQVVGPLHYTAQKQPTHLNLLLIDDSEVKLPQLETRVDRLGNTVMDNVLKFEQHHKQLRLPFCVYADFECILAPIDNHSSASEDMRFVDSYQFLSSKLETLASFLSAEQCRTVRKVFPEDEKFSYMRCKDVSKTVIYDFFYDFLKRQYGDKVSVAYTDTDSLIVHVETDNFYEDMKSHIHYFDTSNYDASNPHNMPQTASELGKMKDEYAGKILSAFYGIGPKAYCIDAVYQVAKRAKGISKASVKNQLHLLHYKDIVEEKRTSVYCTIYVFKSESHNIYTNYIKKVALTSTDDKRFLIPNSTKTLAWGHQDILFHNMSHEERLDTLLHLMQEAIVLNNKHQIA
ncbi:unnamed protein product [Acanthoscelides obtectus]|uniref:DNA-directed DNA polymerase n=1 Tax=Acanthoscelides obtectus TaxID=200917 RepID=A0A9P0Q8N9_ACAOB|nr:unnamed protein product [Acanthoscelides obtectus]CAK1627110.1 hypothetical protein AOBTE_LOCUS4311 [Acanthoscelides obtectus]